MSFFEFPYTRTYSSDLGWLIRHVKWLTDQVENKTIKYADPINWNITSQYELNTVVLDGTVAYLSKQAVPSGVAISNTDYWMPIFDIAPIIGDLSNIRDQISEHYETSYTATRNYSAGDWMFINNGSDDLLYYADSAITINSGLVPGVNITKATVEDIVLALASEIARVDGDLVALDGRVGDLANLTTTDKTSIVNAINELDGDIGDLANLTTTDTSNIVNAINEVDAHADANASDIISLSNRVGELVDLTTTDKTSIVNAINSVESQIAALKSTIYVNVKDYGAVGDGVTDDTAAINDALAYAQTFDLGAALFFPAGEYLISSTLTIPYVSGHGLGGISLIGEGSYASVIFSNNDIDLIEYVGDSTDPGDSYNLFGMVIENIYLRYTGGNSTKTGISFTNCHQVLMIHVKIRYFKTGVYLSYCPNSIFIGVAISANVANARGFDVGDKSISNIYIACFFAASGNASGLSNGAVGFWADRGVIADQTIMYFDVGGSCVEAIHINGVNNTTQQTGDINIINLVCETYYGVVLYNISRHGNVNIIGGWFNCTGDRAGVYLTSSDGVTINGAKFVNNIGSGDVGSKCAVRAANACNDLSVVNCTIKNQYAIDANQTGDGMIVNGNMISLESGVTCQGSLIGTGFKHSIVNNNVIKGNTNRYVRMYSTATYSLCCFNVSDGQNQGTAYQNDAGASTTLSNNING